jgi:hypothetical protein
MTDLFILARPGKVSDKFRFTPGAIRLTSYSKRSKREENRLQLGALPLASERT